MRARWLSIAGFSLVALGCSTQVSAEILCAAASSIARDIKRRQCWPEPFIHADRAATRSPFALQVANGWRRQNMLGDFHFEPSTGQLTEAGRLRVRWILTVCPSQHRLIYVHAAENAEETAARMAAVHQAMAQITPNSTVPVMSTVLPDDGWPADQVDIIERKFRATMPAPRLPSGDTGGAGTASSAY